MFIVVIVCCINNHQCSATMTKTVINSIKCITHLGVKNNVLKATYEHVPVAVINVIK